MEIETLEIEIIEPEPGEGELIRSIADNMTPDRLDLYRIIDGMTDKQIAAALHLLSQPEYKERYKQETQNIIRFAESRARGSWMLHRKGGEEDDRQ